MNMVSYKNAFLISLSIHVAIILSLMFEPHVTRPTLNVSQQKLNGLNIEKQLTEKAIQAVSVDEKEVLAEVNKLKERQKQAQMAEERKQRALKEAAMAAEKKRIAEQQQLEKIKLEAKQLKLAQQKKLEEEKLRLQQIAKQKKWKKKN